MKLSKAETVEQSYYDACSLVNFFSTEGCYREAIDTAHDLGGVEIYNSNDDNSSWYNSNDGNSSWSPVPTRTFEFDDLSRAQIEYDGAFVIKPNEPY